jgi:surface antigen
MTETENPNQDSNDGAAEAAEEARMIRIMQYCDGMLTPRDAAAVAEEIARDPAAARLAAEFSAGAAAARMAWAELESGPVPFDLARRVKHAAEGSAQSRRVVRSPADLRFAATLLVGCLLGAFGLALVQQHGLVPGIGQSGLRLAGSETSTDDAWKPALLSALAKDPATTPIAFDVAGGGTATLQIARWFDSAAGQRCAEFTTTGTMAAQPAGAGDAIRGGIACRKTDGSWDVIEPGE